MVAVSLIGVKVRAGDILMIRKSGCTGGASAYLMWEGLAGYVGNSECSVPDGCITAKALFCKCGESVEVCVAAVVGRVALCNISEENRHDNRREHIGFYNPVQRLDALSNSCRM